MQASICLVDGIGISNQMANHRSAVSVSCRHQNVESACNAGGSNSLHKKMKAAARLMQPHCDAHQLTSKPATVSCSTRQTHRARKQWHDKRSAQQSTRAAAAAPALSSRDPASHAPSPSQPSSSAYLWPVAGTRTPHKGTRGALARRRTTAGCASGGTLPCFSRAPRGCTAP
jgi:hypothetical protein